MIRPSLQWGLIGTIALSIGLLFFNPTTAPNEKLERPANTNQRETSPPSDAADRKSKSTIVERDEQGRQPLVELAINPFASRVLHTSAAQVVPKVVAVTPLTQLNATLINQPVAPPEPQQNFKLFGRVVSPNSVMIVYFVRDEQLIGGPVGSALDNDYFIESVNDKQVSIKHRPSGVQQTFAFVNSAVSFDSSIGKN
jgi:hypothetical protein